MTVSENITMAVATNENIVSAVKNYGKRLFGFIRNKVRSDEDAEDILQDVWYQLSKVVNLSEIEQISGWLYQVARNKITDKYRKKTTSTFGELGFEDEEGEWSLNDFLPADVPTPETEELRELFWEALFVALDELPENQRQVFVWNELEDITLQEIADKTGENLKTIISRKGYAVKHLRKRLENLYNEFINF